MFYGSTLSAAVTFINASVQLTSIRFRETAFGGSGGGGTTRDSSLQPTAESNNKTSMK